MCSLPLASLTPDTGGLSIPILPEATQRAGSGIPEYAESLSKGQMHIHTCHVIGTDSPPHVHINDVAAGERHRGIEFRCSSVWSEAEDVLHKCVSTAVKKMWS